MEIKKHITDLSGNKVTPPVGTNYRVDKIMMGEEWTKAQGDWCDVNYYNHIIFIAEIGKTGKYRVNLLKDGYSYTFGICNLIPKR